MKSLTILALCLACSLNSSLGQSSNSEVTLRGKVMDIKTHKPVNARVDVFYNSDFESQPASLVEGEFRMPLDGYGMYLLSISASGYMVASDTLWVMNAKKKVINKFFYIAPIEVGVSVELSNVYFELGKAELSSESFAELDRTINFFKANPNTSFEIAGHTDRSGEPDYNLKLSKDRAQTVVDYLTSRGVAPSQLTARGYGETKPIRTDLTEEAEARNRRVEVTVLKVSSQASLR